MSFSRTALVLLVVLILSHLTSAAFAMSEEERNFLLMYFKEEELQVVSTTRSLKSVSRVAENVEVVTKEDIELMNAHTLADVLNTVNGVVVNFSGASPGSLALVSIQGSDAEQVAVFMDGVAMNILSSDVALVCDIPVQMIERVEVIKGPASSAWGSSLGGVVNIITKSPGKKEGLNGTASISYGERNTGDFRAEAYGKKEKFGYYVYTGRLQTDGLKPVEKISINNLYAKFSYDASDKTNLSMTLFMNRGDREEGDLSALDIYVKDKTENVLSTLDLNSSLAPGLDLNLSLRAARQRFDRATAILSTGETVPLLTDGRKYGASAKLSWKAGMHSLVAGSDYDYKKDITSSYIAEVPDLNVFAVYANDTMTLGKFTVTPGLRYDHTDRSGDFTSPSIGVTYELAKNTVLRGYIARGFHLPNIGATISDGILYRHNPDLRPEKVWSYQAGIESGLLKYVWLKVSGFRHDISDAIVNVDLDPEAGTWTAVNADRVRRQGVEVAIRTAKFHNFTLSAAAAFVDSKNLTTGEEIRNLPSYTYDVGLRYDDGKSFRGLLKGRYAWWNQEEQLGAKYSSFIFDLDLIKTILRRQDRSCEVFFTGHNIFNGSQYSDEFFRNARRWVEAGVRYKF
jgi:vitamin B12 transporter